MKRAPLGGKLESQRLAVVNTANRPWAVISSAKLETLGYGQLQEFYWSPKGYAFQVGDAARDARVKSVEDAKALVAALKRYAPDVLYVRVSPHTRSEGLAARLRDAFPDHPLVVEFYDASPFFAPWALEPMLGDPESARDAQEGVAAAFHEADAVVVKMGGDIFDQWCKDFPSPVLAYFPGLDEAPVATPVNETSSPLKLLYAGSLSARELNVNARADGAKILGYLDHAARLPGVQLDIFNAAHQPQDTDAEGRFTPILTRYKEMPHVRYHKASPPETMSHTAADFHIGLCCTHAASDTVMPVTEHGLPNRMMTYIGAGLPVLIDHRFTFAASLIEKFQAGAVIEAGNHAAFEAAITKPDLTTWRAGAASLRRDLAAQNILCINRLNHIIHGQIEAKNDPREAP